MMSRERALEVTNESPVVVKHGRVYVSAGIIALIASAVASAIITRDQVQELKIRQTKVEILQADAATKEDVRALSERIDRALELMVKRQ